MTQEKYLERFNEVTKYEQGLTLRKNSDYAGAGNAFQNFNLIEILTSGRISTAAGILVRMTDKIQRVANLLAKPPQVLDESLEDSLIDLSVYSKILFLWQTRHKEDLGLGQAVVPVVTDEPPPLLPGYQELPEGVSQNTIDEAYEELSAKVFAGKVSELTPTQRSLIELLAKMRLKATTGAA